MTTSRTVSKSPSMFSLPRRPSLGPSSSLPSLPPAPCTDMTATSPLSAASTSTTASPISDDDGHSGNGSHGPQMVARRKSNNDKILRLGASATATLPPHVPPPQSSQPQTQRKMLTRSPTADGAIYPHGQQQQQQQRQKARDFALSVSTPTTSSSSSSSPLPPENCSSLRDQFLKIKERFSAPSPNGTKSHSTGSKPVSPTSPASAGRALPLESKTHPLSPQSPASSSSSLPSSATLAVSVPTERLLVELNERTQNVYPAGDLLWPHHAHVERWYVEDNYFKGSMTCWTMEKGAEVIARIARVISTQTNPAAAQVPVASPPTSPSRVKGAGSGRINPDVSLQWIGRQLWAVTVCLPLTRSGELTSDHASIAQAIDDAIAEEVKKAPQECGPRATAPMVAAVAAAAAPTAPAASAPAVVPPALAGAASCGSSMRLNPLLDSFETTSTSGDDARLATLPLDRLLPSFLSPAEGFPTAMAAADAKDDSSTSLDGEEEAFYDAVIDPLPADRVGDKRFLPSDSSVSTVLADEDHTHHHDQDHDQDQDQGADDEHEQEQDHPSTSSGHTQQEESDTVSALPLSLSMLSFTSLQVAAAGSSGGGDQPNYSRGGDHLHLHNGCGKDDDASHRVPPDKTGWLKKKNGMNTWQPRYFELKGNRLFYFASESEGIPRGAIILDHAHVLRGKGDQSMTFTICASTGTNNLQLVKFSARMTSQVHPRKSCVLRVTTDSEETISAWILALNRASFCCHLSANSSASGSSNSVTQSSSSTTSSTSPTRKKRNVFYRLRSPSSSASSADDDNRSCSGTATSSSSSSSTPPATIDSTSYHHYGSVKYLQDTDPLLWEIHPHDQQKIRKKALLARTKSDYLSILTKYSSTVRQIFLPRPRPITIEQTLRDILPELFLINNVLYGGGDENNGLENIFEVLDGCIKKFASAQDERVRAVSALLQACARTISGGDSYFVVHSLLGNPFMIIRPAEARGHPIEVNVSTTNPSQFCITVFSAFSFHHIEDVENCGDSSSATGSGGGGAMMPEPLLRVQTYHVQEFDFANGKSSRWLRIRTDGMKDDHEIGGGGTSGGVASGGMRSGNASGGGSSSGSSSGGWMSKRSPSETGFGALLDALS